MSRPKTSIIETVVEGDKTTFVWRVGQVRSLNFGTCIKSPVVRVGERSFWQARYFPKGFTDPDWASVYVTSIDCELKGVDGEDPTKITQSAFATVTVSATPKPRNPEAEEPQKKGGKEEQAPDDDDDDDDASVESLSTKKSETGSKKGSQKSKGSRKSVGSSRRSGSVRNQAGDSPAAAGAGGPAPVVPVEKELSQMYTNLEPSWGFEKMLDMGLLYKWSEGWMNDYGEGKEGNENKANTQDGFINFTISILAVANIRMDSVCCMYAHFLYTESCVSFANGCRKPADSLTHLQLADSMTTSDNRPASSSFPILGPCPRPPSPVPFCTALPRRHGNAKRSPADLLDRARSEASLRQHWTWQEAVVRCF